MANLLVMMEFFRGELLPASLEALGQARRLGTTFGLSVYALVPLPSEPDSGDEDLTARCGRYGADKVVMLTGEGLQSEGEMRFACYAGALLAACSQLPPRLLLLGDTPAARDIAPRLASRLGAAYLPRGAALEVDGQLVLCDETGSHVMVDSESGISEGMLPPPPPPVLMTVPPGRFQLASGAQDAEMMIIAAADCVQTSDATPVAAAGFAEEGLDPLPLASRLAGPGPQDEDAESVVPALWRLQAGSVRPPAGADTAQFHIALGPEDENSASADYLFVVPEAELATIRGTLLTQLAQPAPPKAEVQWSARSGFSESSQFTPTGELDGWGIGQAAPTGDTDTTREVVAPAPAPRPPEEPPPPAAAAPAAQALTRSPVLAPIDASMWEGFATLPRPGEGTAEGEGTPIVELETADTAPVPIVAPSAQSLPRLRVENAGRSSQSPHPAAPSAQSPVRGRGAQKAKSDKDAKDAKDEEGEKPASGQGSALPGTASGGQAGGPLSDWTEDP